MNYTEIICSLIAFLGVVLSGFVSWFTARYAAKKEAEKMLLSWKHESEVSFEEEFPKWFQLPMSLSCAEAQNANGTSVPEF